MNRKGWNPLPRHDSNNNNNNKRHLKIETMKAPTPSAPPLSPFLFLSNCWKNYNNNIHTNSELMIGIMVLVISLQYYYSFGTKLCNKLKQASHHKNTVQIIFHHSTKTNEKTDQEESTTSTTQSDKANTSTTTKNDVHGQPQTQNQQRDCGSSSMHSSVTLPASNETETINFVESKYYEIIDCLSVIVYEQPTTTTTEMNPTDKSSSPSWYVDGFQKRHPKQNIKQQQQSPYPGYPPRRSIMNIDTPKTTNVRKTSHPHTDHDNNKNNTIGIVNWSKVEQLWNEIEDTYQAEPICRFVDDDQQMTLLSWMIAASSSSTFSDYKLILKLLRSVYSKSQPNVLTLPNHYGMTSFHYAKYYHCPRFILKWMTSTIVDHYKQQYQQQQHPQPPTKQLLSTSPNSSSNSLTTPKPATITTHHTNIILDVLNQEDNYGKTPIDYELERKFYQILELISYLEEQPSSRNGCGGGVVVDRIPKSPHHIQWTMVEDIWYSIDTKLGGGKRYVSQLQDDLQGAPLVTWLVATKSPPLQLLQSVIHAYPHSVQIQDKAGMIAYHHAKYYSSPRYVTQVLYDIYPDCVAAKCHQGYTPMDWEMERKFECLLECVSRINPKTQQREPKQSQYIDMTLVNELWDEIIQQTHQTQQMELLHRYKTELLFGRSSSTTKGGSPTFASTFDTSFDC